MDNRFAKSRMSIGESSNLAQLAMTYYWTYPDNQELYDNFVILSVLAQVAIDSCKREYEVDPIMEIERIKNMDCMNLSFDYVLNKKGNLVKHKRDLPMFMQYTKEVKHTKNGKELPYEEVKEKKEKIKNRIDDNLVCPMNWLEDILDKINTTNKSNTTPTENFFIKMEGKANNQQMTKIRKIVDEYDDNISKLAIKFEYEDELYAESLSEYTKKLLSDVSKIKIGNIVTINRIIETSLSIEKKDNAQIHKLNSRYTRKILNVLYRTNKDKFLSNFVKNEQKNKEK